MDYHVGRWKPPPAAPMLPDSALRAIALPDTSTPVSLRLPPPPAAAQRSAELPVVHELVAARTPEGDAWARHLDERGASSTWWGPAREVRRTRGLLPSLELRGAIAAGQLAAVLAPWIPGQPPTGGIPRPFQLDASIPLIVHRPGTSSYPSGHARIAYASGRIVSLLDPAQEQGAMALARDVAVSRVYAGAHLPSDVVAGARIGIAVGDAVVGAIRATRAAARVVAPAAALGGVAALAVAASRSGSD